MKHITIIGGGVAGVYFATKLIKEGFPGKNITIIDKGKDPYQRKPEEVMCGYLGAGAWSDGKLVYLHNAIGGHLAKYCGEEKATSLVKEVVDYIKEFHPDPSKMMFSDPKIEPDFIKPYFNLRLAPTWHIGTNYLHEMGKRWFDWMVEQGVNFEWEKTINNIDFKDQTIIYEDGNMKQYDILFYATGKSGIDLTQKIITDNRILTETKPVQIGVRFEAPQKYFQKMVDISYDFKLYQKPNDKVSLRSFCTNNFAAYIAEEETYGMKSYNGHSYKEESKINNMTNFGIIMEIKNIDNPYEWALDAVSKCQINGKGVYYSPNGVRKPSLTSEGNLLDLHIIDETEVITSLLNDVYGEYSYYIWNYIRELNEVFQFKDDYGLYIPEVKFLSDEVLVNYEDLSLKQYPNVYFAGDSLSSRGIVVSGAQGLYIAESILKKHINN